MDRKLEDLLSSHSFVLWIKGACTDKQKAYWDSWLEDDPKRGELVHRAKEIEAALSPEYGLPDRETELSKLNQKIDRFEENFQRNNYSSKYKLPQLSKGIVAASLLFIAILIGSAGVYFYSERSETENPENTNTAQLQNYSTDFGEKLTFGLSDGSKIVLNANSNLKFSSQIKKGLNTEVWLDGEAYFDIAGLEDGEQRTFTVHTRNGSIQVLGTRFAVNTFQKETQTVLEEGKIQIHTDDVNRVDADEYFLNPGELARFERGAEKIIIKKVNTRIYTSWTEDKFVFDRASMPEVARRIEHTFGVNVIIGKEIAGESISGTIRCDNLKVIKEALSKLIEVPIMMKNQKLYIGEN